jgi:hypothetical protein
MIDCYPAKSDRDEQLIGRLKSITIKHGWEEISLPFKKIYPYGNNYNRVKAAMAILVGKSVDQFGNPLENGREICSILLEGLSTGDIFAEASYDKHNVRGLEEFMSEARQQLVQFLQENPSASFSQSNSPQTNQESEAFLDQLPVGRGEKRSVGENVETDRKRIRRRSSSWVSLESADIDVPPNSSVRNLSSHKGPDTRTTQQPVKDAISCFGILAIDL